MHTTMLTLTPFYLYFTQIGLIQFYEQSLLEMLFSGSDTNLFRNAYLVPALLVPAFLPAEVLHNIVYIYT